MLDSRQNIHSLQYSFVFPNQSLNLLLFLAKWIGLHTVNNKLTVTFKLEVNSAVVRIHYWRKSIESYNYNCQSTLEQIGS